MNNETNTEVKNKIKYKLVYIRNKLYNTIIKIKDIYRKIKQYYFISKSYIIKKQTAALIKAALNNNPNNLKSIELYNSIIKSISEITSSSVDEDDVQKKLNEVSPSLSQSKLVEEILEKFLSSRMTILDLQNNINKRYKKLRKNIEWNTFTIAFYGETNAGKSTIIEILRIMLNEPTKIEERNKFKKLQEQGKGINEKAQERLKKQLKKYADGNIIGDGRSDFTKNNRIFKFNWNGIEFNIIDVPGIEGEEKSVMTHILQAVQKAHAVFYITRTPRPPQTGDKGKQGTLQKIKQHLGAQTEVWAIYNKPITSLEQIKKVITSKTLLDSDDEEGLKDLSNKLKEELTTHYQGIIQLSANPAYQAVAEFITNDKQKYNKEKFCKEYSKNELLEFSGMKEFINKLQNSVIGDLNVIRAKIDHSNLNKALETLKEAILIINEQQKILEPTKKELTIIQEETSEKIKNTLNDLKTSLRLLGSDMIEQFISNVRKDMYNVIKSDVDNKRLISRMEKSIKERSTEMKEVFSTQITQQLGSFGIKLGQIVKQAQKEITEILNKSYLSSNDDNQKFDFYSDLTNLNLQIETDSGLQIGGLLTALVGSAMLFFGPAGWLAMSASIGTILSGLIGGLRNFISTDYKMSQQREKINEILRNKIYQELHNSLQKHMDSLFLQIIEKTDEIEGFLSIAMLIVSDKIQELSRIEDSLNQLYLTHSLKLN
ncbi:AAA family ATPase [Cardiobacterium valvarum]|uniref:Uncharacterized protein n=1 Tax=Cardiobacterium valvarum F0432 TaxID=797473 RepID=G9ZHE9_9GAMM|nr:AAA family ATPase [Cardiobacterium valvarum]EHM52628.1 hypothetical protein HMPREF9080_02183 [Cardiobacterium valvarum F0432]